MSNIRKSKLVFFLIILCFACSSSNIENKEEVNIKNTDSSFIEIISCIPQLKLPFILNCGLENGLPWTKDLGVDISRFIPENTKILGKLPIDNGNVYIIYGIPGDIIYPYLIVFNKFGKKIDSLYLHIGYCIGDAFEITTNTTTINKDYSIAMVDTTQFIHYLDENEKIIDSIIVKINDFKLTNKGLYKRYKKESVRIR
jgi:hypothetical protein